MEYEVFQPKPRARLTHTKDRLIIASKYTI